MNFLGYNPELFQKLGILIDKEDDIYENDTNSDNDNIENNKYILQLFTHPLFASDTFFLELIQRHGARYVILVDSFNSKATFGTSVLNPGAGFLRIFTVALG